MRTTMGVAGGSEALRRRARLMSAFGKGLLALDTPPTVLAARLRDAEVVPTDEVAAAYRSTLLATPGLATLVSSVVLTSSDLQVVPGVLVGVRADTGFERWGTSPAEAVTTGLDGLTKRLDDFRESGAAFAVWAMSIGAAGGHPTMRALTVDAAAAARFACACQMSGLVPVVRVGTRLRDGTSDRSRELRILTMMIVCNAAADLDVDPGGLVLSMSVEPGDGGAIFAAVPPALGGMALDGVAPGAVALGPAPDVPCPVTFYAGRAVTGPALRAWGGRTETARAGQEMLWASLEAVSRSVNSALSEEAWV